MYSCPACKSELGEALDAEFCWNCGAVLSDTVEFANLAVVRTEASSNAARATARPSMRTTERRVALGFLLLVCVPAALLCIGYVLLAIQGGREEHPLYEVLLFLGLFVYPALSVVALILLLVLTLLAFVARTLGSAILGLQGALLLFVMLNFGFDTYWGSIHALSIWHILQASFLALSAATILTFRRGEVA
jgi:hypothetical protein